jgi:hypothetical protein
MQQLAPTLKLSRRQPCTCACTMRKHHARGLSGPPATTRPHACLPPASASHSLTLTSLRYDCLIATREANLYADNSSSVFGVDGAEATALMASHPPLPETLHTASYTEQVAAEFPSELSSQPEPTRVPRKRGWPAGKKRRGVRGKMVRG